MPTASGPVFVVGSMRSGSTLLRLVLDSHPDIAIGAETGFMRGLRAVKDIPNWRAGNRWYERLGWTEPEIDERLREFYGGLFERYAAAQGKPRWGEKTPFHTEHVPEMARVFPDAVFVGIVRHPGAVASSLRKNFHWRFPDGLEYWTRINDALVRSGTELGDRFTLCRYEDLVLEEEPVLRALVGWLGERWDPCMLQHHRVQREKGARGAEGGTRADVPVEPERAVRWADSLDDHDVLALQDTAALAGFFGYAPLDPDVRHRLGPDAETGPCLVTGTDLARRRHEWSDRVTFERRPPAALPDGTVEELAGRLAHAESVIARVRSRRAVRLADAARTIQHGRSLQDLRRAWTLVRGPRRDGTR